MTPANPASASKPASVSPPSPGEAAARHRMLVVYPGRCVGCRTCEVACSFAHASNGKPGPSRIRIHPAGPERFVQVTCLQCVNAACAAACPTRALRRNEVTRAIELDERLCVGCGLCEAACPFGHLQFSRELHLPLKCDLCGGNPACAAFCPHGALEWR